MRQRPLNVGLNREDETMRLAIWSTTTPRENSTHVEMFQRQLAEVELAERIGIDQIWFFEHHLQPTAPVPSPNLLIAAAAPRTAISASPAWSTSCCSAIRCSWPKRRRCSTI
jgi:hypothetical protein